MSVRYRIYKSIKRAKHLSHIKNTQQISQFVVTVVWYRNLGNAKPIGHKKPEKY